MRLLTSLSTRLRNELLLLNILVIILIIIITFFPSSIVLRVALGLPFLLFFPGYTLIAALFPRKSNLDSIERVALSFGLSIAVVPLTGLALNYTPWGIRLYPILISLTIFIFATSIIAWFRRRKLPEEERISLPLNLSFPNWRGRSSLDRALSIILAVAILAAVGTLGYVIATPKVGEKFTEFYILGPEGKAENYPTEFVMNGGKIIQVSYGGKVEKGDLGKVIVGIVNHEQEEASYRVEVRINAQNVGVWLDGTEVDEVSPIVLSQGEKWEHEIGFAPEQAGDKQKVEFILYKGDKAYFEVPPCLHINVRST
jgi:uncharacterized membrane protein